MAESKSVPRSVRQEVMNPAKILRELLRHYTEFRERVAAGGDHIIQYSYNALDEHGEVQNHTIAFSFWDLHRGIKDLAPRKREALYWNVIRDYKQRDVAEIMGITTVSVGQYCLAAVEALVSHHFPELKKVS